MFVKLLVKRIIPALIVLALLALGGLWLYGFLGVKNGWIGLTDYPNLNPIVKSGADAGGGMGTIAKGKIGL
jgi:hypothetical protein